MAKDKRSFFEKLTGTVRLDEREHEAEEEQIIEQKRPGILSVDEESADAELTVDVHQTPSEIIVKTMAAGVRPEDLDISITRDTITIRGKREGDRTVSEDNYFFRELYWGSFSRTIMLPAEVEPEEAEAIEKHGLIIIKIPKINKGKQTKLRIKTL